MAATPSRGGCAEIRIKFALRRPTQLARFTERLFEQLAINLVYFVMLRVNATSRSVAGLTTDHDVAHCAYFSASRASSRNLLRKEPKARLIPGARPSGAGFALGSESQVRCSLAGGGRRFRTIGRALQETAVQGRPAANHRPLARRPVLNDLHPAHRFGRQQLRDPFSQEQDPCSNPLPSSGESAANSAPSSASSPRSRRGVIGARSRDGARSGCHFLAPRVAPAWLSVPKPR
jgi:hypothetical protein